MLSEAEARERLAAAIAASGGQHAFAKTHGFSSAYISDVVRHRRDLSERLLAALGLERVVLYREVVGSVVGSTPPKAEEDR